MNNNPLNIIQLICIFMLSIGLMNHVIVIPLLLDAAGRDAWISAIIALGALPLWLPLLYFIMKQSKQMNLFLWLKTEFNSAIAYFVAILGSLLLLVISYITLSDTVTFTTTTYLTRTPDWAILLTLTVMCFYNAYHGIPSIAKTAVILLPFVFIFGIFDHSGLETLIISEQTLRDHFSRCKDVAILTATIQPDNTASGALTLVFVYCEELCDTQLMKQVIFPMFHEMCRKYPCHSVNEIEANKLLPMELLGKEVLMDDLDYHLFNGDLLVYFQEADVLYSLTLANPPNRDPEEPNTEVSIRGPKDGFIEEISKNVALIRKRIKSYKLCYEQFIVGTRSQTKVGLMYIDDIANREMIHEVKKEFCS